MALGRFSHVIAVEHSLSKPVILLLLTALAYVVATIAMKAAATTLHTGTVLWLIVSLAAVGVLEVLVLQRVNLAAAYVTVLGIETLLVLGFATAIGEGLAPREMAGAALVLFGAIILVT